MGRLDRARARGFFTQGLLLAFLCGAALSAVMYFGEDRYLALLSGSEYVEMYGRQYLDWMWPVGLTKCLMMFLALFCYADGDFRLCPIAYGVVFVTNAAVSYVAVDQGMGASGCALGTFVSEALGALILCTHFFRRINTAGLSRHFSLRDSYYIVRASFGNVSALLCDAVLFFVVNKLVIARFDPHRGRRGRAGLRGALFGVPRYRDLDLRRGVSGACRGHANLRTLALLRFPAARACLAP